MVASLILSAFIGPKACASEFLKPVSPSVIISEITSFETLPKYHFELAAPQWCDELAKIKPIAATPRKILCRYPLTGERRVSLSVCDNAKTFCKPEAFPITVNPNTKGLSEVRAAAPSEDLKKMQTELKEKTLPGFHHILPEEILKTRGKKPVFVMVSTDWCPPCNEAKEALLSTPAFQEAMSDFHLIYADGDSEADLKAWAPYLPFWFYPTFALMTPDLKDVARYGGQFRLYDFKDWIGAARADLTMPIADLEKTVRLRKSGNFKQELIDLFQWNDTKKDQDRLIAWAIASHNKNVQSLFQDSDIPRAMRSDWLRDRLQFSEGTTEEKMLLRLRLLEASKDDENFTGDLQVLCEENTTACKPWVEKLKNRKNFWDTRRFASPAEKAIALIEDYSNQTDLYNVIGDKENAQKAAEACAVASDNLAKNSPLKLSRAALIGESYCLGEIGRAKEADAIYKKLIENYHSEPTFFIRYANFLKKQERLGEAHQWISKALASAYGYNWMKAVTLKAKIEIAMKDKPAALSTIHSALAELDLSSGDPEDRDQKLARAFRSLESDVEKQ